MAVEENLELGAWPFRGDKARLQRKLQENYERFPALADRRRSQAGELSGGMQRMVELGRALMTDPKVILVDEPTAGLDAEAEYEVFRRFGELTAGRIAVLISHRFSTVRMADRIVVIEGGHITEVGSHQELLTREGTYFRLFNIQAEGYR